MRYLSIRSGQLTTAMGSIFHPLTPIYESRRVQNVRLTVWLLRTEVSTSSELRAAPGIAYSNDGVNWNYDIGDGDNYAVGVHSDYNGAVGSWITGATAMASVTDGTERTVVGGAMATCPGLGSSGPRFEKLQEVIDGGHPRKALNEDMLYCRFGVFVTNTSTGDVYPQGGMAALDVEFTDIDSGTITTIPVVIDTNGNTSDPGHFTPLTETMEMAKARFFRVTYMVEAAGGATVQPGYQTSNDGVTWDSPTQVLLPDTSERTRSTDGYDYGTYWLDLGDPESPTVDEKYIRFGMYAVGGDGTHVGCRVAMRIDWRGY